MGTSEQIKLLSLSPQKQNQIVRGFENPLSLSPGVMTSWLYSIMFKLPVDPQSGGLYHDEDEHQDLPSTAHHVRKRYRENMEESLHA